MAAAGLCRDASAAAGDFRGSFKHEFVSSYMSSASGLRDTRPNMTDMLAWNLSLGDAGYLCGYFWAISALHDMQHRSHRPFFYDTEAIVQYGKALRFGDAVSLNTEAGPYFDVPFGYRNAHMKCWGSRVAQRLDNPWVVPYWNGIWIIETTRRARIVVGLEKGFAFSETFSITPFVQTTWMDRRRFRRRFGSEPDRYTTGDGAFTTLFYGVRLGFKASENIRFIVTAAMYDVVNSQARRITRRSHDYSARCDWPIFRAGMEFRF